MPLSEAYSYLLADSFITMLIFPFQNYFVFKVMQLFGTYSPNIMIIIASIGATLAACTNYALGIAIKRFAKFQPTGEKWDKFLEFAKKQEFALSMACFVPFFAPLFTTALGFLGIRIKVFAPTVLMANIIFFIILLTI